MLTMFIRRRLVILISWTFLVAVWLRRTWSNKGNQFNKHFTPWRQFCFVYTSYLTNLVFYILQLLLIVFKCCIVISCYHTLCTCVLYLVLPFHVFFYSKALSISIDVKSLGFSSWICFDKEVWNRNRFFFF